MTAFLRTVPTDQSAAAVTAADQVLGAGETRTEPTIHPGYVDLVTSSRHEGQPAHKPWHTSRIAEAVWAASEALHPE